MLEGEGSSIRRERGSLAARILRVSALGLGVALLPSAASGSHLFGPEAGWDKARGGPEAVRVWADPSLKVRIRHVIGPWNRLAGRRLFRAVPAAGRADVVFRPARTTWVQCLPSYEESYDRCIIWSATSFTSTLRHELGHTLGLADHIQVIFAEAPYINPRLCDAPSLPEFSLYEGVMSYCAWDDGFRGWFGATDLKMLVDAGYATRPAGAGEGVSEELEGIAGEQASPSSATSVVGAANPPADGAGILMLLVFAPGLVRLAGDVVRRLRQRSSRSTVG